MLRQFVMHPWQVFLSITGIALGVGVVLAIDLTNASSERGFIISNQSVAGVITHQIVSDSGFIDESTYVDLRIAGLRDITPVVEGWVRMQNGQRFRLTGIDPLALAGLRESGPFIRDNGSLATSLLETGAVFISGKLKESLNVALNSPLEAMANGKEYTLFIAGLSASGKNLQDQALGSSLVTDISTAQDVLDMPGQLSRIDLILDEPEMETVNKLISPPLRLIKSNTRSNAMEQMTRAFRLNLTALSMLAMVIGAFLIYNTMTISVLQRRELIATLRTLGLKRLELLMLITGEALLLALAGLLSGYLLGTGLSHYLIKLASRTINDLYFVTEIQTVYLNSWSFLKATLLGLGATLLASYFPARDAMAIAPEMSRSRSNLELKIKSLHRSRITAAVLFAMFALVTLVSSGKSIVAGFTALSFIILSFAMISPLLLVLLVNLTKPVLTTVMGLTGTIAGRGVLSSLSRTQVAVTALAIAISATIGVSIMINSFRASVQEWLTGILQADVYISSGDDESQSMIAPGLIEQVRTYPGVVKLDTAYRQNIWLGEVPVQLLIRDIDEETFSHYRFIHGSKDSYWEKYSKTDSVIVSEPFSYHNNVKPGDSINLSTDFGTRRFEVAGVYVDYSSDQGIIGLHRDIYKKYWRDTNVASLSVYLDKSIDSANFSEELNRDILDKFNLIARPNRSLRNLSMQIFDRTFSITQVLRLLTIIIAFTGILGALMAIQLERGREFAVLRANGMTPWELKRLIIVESGLMGTAAGIIAIPLGVLLALVLIHVINRRSFGWTMDFVLSPEYLVTAIVLGLTAGILAGFWPARRMAAISPAIALHDE